MTKILIGMSGWSYDDWRGVVYPPDAGSRFDRLVYLAHLCDTIEINSSFYRIPNRRSVESWLGRVGDLPDFQFSAKLYKGLTHDRDKATVDGLLDQTLATFQPLFEADRLAAILLQFPWSFKFSGESMAWLEKLVDRLRPMPLAVEVRHTSWLEGDYFDFLKSRDIAFCNIDQPYFSSNITPTDLTTAQFAYVRFHGRNAINWFAENEDASARYDYLYGSEELDDWAARIRRMADQTRRIYIYMNNHVGGQGLTNALQLKAKLAGKKVPAPSQLLLKFPQLQDITVPYNEFSVPASRSRKKQPKNDPTEGWLF